MTRGGYRPGAGRPKGAKKAGQTAVAPPISADIKREAQKAGMLPVDYMLAVMNDPTADQARRDRMAVAAAPFIHPRVADNRFGKKDAAAEAAQTAGKGSDWGDDLTTPLSSNTWP
jgi:hypothetical protein